MMKRAGHFQQKESLGEYGSGWGWDDTWPYVFSYEQGDGSPTKYANSIDTAKPTVTGTWVNYGSSTSKTESRQCVIENTNGQILASGSNILHSISCKPHVYNAGNLYNFPATSADSSEPATRSICSRGWMLPQNLEDTSYANLFTRYGIDFGAATGSNRDVGINNFPLSYLRSGFYDSGGVLNDQDTRGNYRMTSFRMQISSGIIIPANSTLANNGYSLRSGEKII